MRRVRIAIAPGERIPATWTARSVRNDSPRLVFYISPAKTTTGTQEAYPADTISLRSVTSDNL